MGNVILLNLYFVILFFLLLLQLASLGLQHLLFDFLGGCQFSKFIMLALDDHLLHDEGFLGFTF